MLNVLWILFFLLFPAFVIILDRKSPLIHKLGPVVICYLTGLLVGNVNILPEDFRKTQDLINTIVVPLAIPLLLFSLNAKAWIGMAPRTFLSLVLGLVSVLVTVFLGYFWFGDRIPGTWQVSGMLIGLYSGGTPNLASLQLALGVDPELYLLTHSYDLVVGAFTLLFLMTVAQRFFLLFMRPYKSSDREKAAGDANSYYRNYESYSGIFGKAVFLPLLLMFGLAVLIFAVSGGISLLVPESTQMAVVIMSITTLSIAASFIPRVRNTEKTFQGGMYLILIFCLVVSSMADLSLFNFHSLALLLYVILAVIGSLLLHALLSKIFNIDVDNFMIVSTALSMSPPFVPVVAGAIKNRDVIFPGLVIGIIGYALGNYLGILVAHILK